MSSPQTAASQSPAASTPAPSPTQSTSSVSQAPTTSSSSRPILSSTHLPPIPTTPTNPSPPAATSQVQTPAPSASPTQPSPTPTSSPNNSPPTSTTDNNASSPSETKSSSVAGSSSFSTAFSNTLEPSSTITLAASTVVSDSSSLLTSNGVVFTTIVHATIVVPASTITPLSPSASGIGNNTNKGGVKVGAIAGGIIGGIALGGILFALVFFARRRTRRLQRTDYFDGNFDPSRVVVGGTLPNMSPSARPAAALDTNRMANEKHGSAPVEDDGMGGRLEGTRVTPFPSPTRPVFQQQQQPIYETQSYFHSQPQQIYHNRQVSDTRSLAPGGYAESYYAGPAYGSDAYQVANAPYDPYAGHRSQPPSSPTHQPQPSVTSSGGMIPSAKEREARAERESRRVANPSQPENIPAASTAHSALDHSPGQASERQSTISLPNPHDPHPATNYVTYEAVPRTPGYDTRPVPSAYDRRASTYFDSNNHQNGEFDSGVIVHQDGGHVAGDGYDGSEIPPTYNSLSRR